MSNKTIALWGTSVAMAGLWMAAASVWAEDPKTPAAEGEKAPVPAAAPAAPEAAKPAMPPATSPLTPGSFDVTKTGTINVTKDAAGKVIGIKLVVSHYEVVLNDASKPLEDLDGKKVRLLGQPGNDAGRRIFTVKSFEVVPADESGLGKLTVPEAKPPEVKPVESKVPEKPAETPAEAPTK